MNFKRTQMMILPFLQDNRKKIMGIKHYGRVVISVVVIELMFLSLIRLMSSTSYLIDIDDPDALYQLQQQSLKMAEHHRNYLLKVAESRNNKKFYKSVKLEAFCGNKLRIGGNDDGGKYVCNPKAVRKDDCVILSLGLNNQIDFDKQIYQITGRQCTLLGADKDVQNAETRKSYEKMKSHLFAGLVPQDVTISSMMKKFGKAKSEILKIDIEGAEHIALEPFLKEYPVCQILIEIHGTPAEHLRMLQTMARFDFRIFNVEPNPYCKSCCEYSLISEQCMDQFGAAPLAITIPKET